MHLRGVRSPNGPVFPIKRTGHKVVALCTDDDILTEVTLGVYIYPENPWILETPSSLKPLLTRGSLYPLRFWIFSFLVPSPSILENSEALESLRSKLDLWSRWTTEAENCGWEPSILETLKPSCLWFSWIIKTKIESLVPLKRWGRECDYDGAPKGTGSSLGCG